MDVNVLGWHLLTIASLNYPDGVRCIQRCMCWAFIESIKQKRLDMSLLSTLFSPNSNISTFFYLDFYQIIEFYVATNLSKVICSAHLGRQLYKYNVFLLTQSIFHNENGAMNWNVLKM